MKIRKVLLWTLMVIGVFIITGCASQPEPSPYDPPGFFMGIFHGFIILFSFVGSIFMDVRIYTFPNSGIIYDFGYLLGLFFWLALLG